MNDDVPPPQIKGFEAKRCLGKGVHGTVWLVEDKNIGRLCAAKLLNHGSVRKGAAERLINEGERLGRLPKHNNRVEIHQLICEPRCVAIVMEYVEGASLADRVADETISLERRCRYIADVAEALVDVHGAGILHLDISPRNVLLSDKRDCALLCDFGLAEACATSPEGCRGIPSGTPGFTAPELLDERPTPAADVFSLTATLFFAVTGEPPFRHSTQIGCLTKAKHGHYPKEAIEALPSSIASLIHDGLCPDAERRLTLNAFRQRLQGIISGLLVARLAHLSPGADVPVAVQLRAFAAQDPRGPYNLLMQCQLRGNRADDHGAFAGVQVKVGQFLRLGVSASCDGFLTIVNFASSGALSVLFPNGDNWHDRLCAFQEMYPFTVRVRGPAGYDYVAAIWSRSRMALTPDEWRRSIEGGLITPGLRQQTRDMDLIPHLGELSDDAWKGVVLRIEHDE